MSYQHPREIIVTPLLQPTLHKLPCSHFQRWFPLRYQGFFYCPSEMASEEYSSVAQPQGPLCTQTFRVKNQELYYWIWFSLSFYPWELGTSSFKTEDTMKENALGKALYYWSRTKLVFWGLLPRQGSVCVCVLWELGVGEDTVSCLR